MSIPQAGKEGYLIKVTPENYLELLKIVPTLTDKHSHVNYDPKYSSYVFPAYERTPQHILAEATLLTMEEFKILFFIETLEK